MLLLSRARFTVLVSLVALACGPTGSSDTGDGAPPGPVTPEPWEPPPPGFAETPGGGEPSPQDPPPSQPPGPGPETPEPGPVADPGPPAGPLDQCHLTVTGALGQADGPIVYTGGAVEISATHHAQDRCLTSFGLVLRRQGKCPLTLLFEAVNGAWQLKSATLRSDPECGEGWGSGKTYVGVAGTLDGTLLGSPTLVAQGTAAQSCTVLPERIDLAGTFQAQAGGVTLTLTLTGLSLDGYLLTEAVPSGGCGASPEACSALECGVDPVFGVNCGSCQSGMFCLAGGCVEGSPAQEACARFNQDRAQMFEGQWSGNVVACSASSMSDNWQEAALLSVNLYRWFAGLPPLVLQPSWYGSEQQCALMIHANKALSHNPPSWWSCYSGSGADAAGSSNIATMPAVKAVDLYMIDPGNESTLGHRRWILSNWLSATAFGSTSSYSCMRTQSGGGVGTNPWTAWPPPGYYPLDWNDLSWTALEETGWSLQSDDINLSQANVTVTEGGQNRPMWVSSLYGGYGSQYAIKMMPQGWALQPNRTYTVKVTGTSPPISYQFTTLDCSSLP